MSIFDVAGKVILFTGAKGHLGQPIADHLEEAGATVIRLSRSAEDGAQSYQLDITDQDAVDAAVAKIKDRFGRIDGLVNNAYSGKAGVMEKSTRADFKHSLDMNLTAPFMLIQSLFDLYSDGASIVNIASMYGMVSPDPRIYGDSGHNNPIYYGAGKAGLIQMSKYLACHLGDKNVRVNSVSPGPFPNFGPEHLNGPFHKELEKKVPLGRIGRPDELKGVIHFLLSNSSSFITGTNIPVDGGWTAW